MRYLIFVLTLFSVSAYSQRPGGYFLDQQWWIGIRGGLNVTEAVPQTSVSAFSPINYDVEETEKSYSSYDQIGVWVGLEFTYSFKQFSVGFQPNFRRQSFSYSNSYSWQNAETGASFFLNTDQGHDLDYLELPLIFKYEYKIERWTPFVQFGGYYGYLLNANKQVELNGLDEASGGQEEFILESFSLGATSLFVRSSVGLLGGIGTHYSLGNIRLTFDITYRYGLNNIASVEDRFSDNRLAGIGDALDDIELRNLAFSVGALFPLRFLSSGYTAF
ncbi:MAG: PorT family protein [Bacteroidota bacterium]